MSKYIYCVGKPYPHKEVLEAIRGLGFQAGLLLDKNVSHVKTENYDRVITLDFSSSESITQNLNTYDLQAAGLLCTYENYVPAKSWLGEHLGLPALSGESARMCTDKYAMRQAFINADPSITPNFGLVSSEEELLNLASTLSYPLIIKPTNLVKSLLVMRCNSEEELLRNFAYAKTRIAGLYRQHNVYGREPQLIVEEYITGKTCSVAAFVDETGTPHFCRGVTSLTNAQDIGVDDNYIYARHLPGRFDPALEEQFFDIARKGIKALKMTSTPAHVELIYNNDGVKLIEIGARIGGYRPRMYGYSYGLDLIQQEIKLALGQQPELAGDFRQYCGVYELFPEKEGEFATVDGDSDTSAYAYYSVKARPGQMTGPAKNGYKASVVAVVASNDPEQFLEICKTIDNLKIRTN